MSLVGQADLARVLAVSEVEATLSLVGQVGAMVVAAVVGRFVLRSRAAVGSVAVLGAVGAMFAHVVVDGQGAFGLLIYAPVIYFVAVVGRGDLDRRRGG